jgi:hypothetical protein
MDRSHTQLLAGIDELPTAAESWKLFMVAMALVAAFVGVER